MFWVVAPLLRCFRESGSVLRARYAANNYLFYTVLESLDPTIFAIVRETSILWLCLLSIRISLGEGIDTFEPHSLAVQDLEHLLYGHAHYCLTCTVNFQRKP